MPVPANLDRTCRDCYLLGRSLKEQLPPTLLQRHYYRPTTSHRPSPQLLAVPRHVASRFTSPETRNTSFGSIPGRGLADDTHVVRWPVSRLLKYFGTCSGENRRQLKTQEGLRRGKPGDRRGRDRVRSTLQDFQRPVKGLRLFTLWLS